MKLNLKIKSMSGQALTSVLILLTIGMSVITVSSGLINSSILTTSKLLESSEAYSIAESGAETTLLQILRNPYYNGGVINFENGTAQITVTSTSPFTFISKGVLNNYQRSIQVIINYQGGFMTVQSWKEI